MSAIIRGVSRFIINNSGTAVSAMLAILAVLIFFYASDHYFHYPILPDPYNYWGECGALLIVLVLAFVLFMVVQVDKGKGLKRRIFKSLWTDGSQLSHDFQQPNNNIARFFTLGAPRTPPSENIVHYIKKTFWDDVEKKHDKSAYPDLKWGEHRKKYYKGRNWTISANVYHRLCLRHALLQDMEVLEENYTIHQQYPDVARFKYKYDLLSKSIKGDADTTSADGKCFNVNIGCQNADKSGGNDGSGGVSAKLHLDMDDNNAFKAMAQHRAYRLATTDLFVEKAIAYLEEDYNRYLAKGVLMYKLAFIPILVGILIALVANIGVDDQKKFALSAVAPFGKSENSVDSPDVAKSKEDSFNSTVSQLIDLQKSVNGDGSEAKSSLVKEILKASGQNDWRRMLERFTKGFTLFGLLVLCSVFCLRYGRAMLDQAERLRERRHALRQGRLFVHLKDGDLTVEELEKAFSWNVSKGNAFGNMATEASAPWGAVFRDAMAYLAGILPKAKAVGSAASRLG